MARMMRDRRNRGGPAEWESLARRWWPAAVAVLGVLALVVMLLVQPTRNLAPLTRVQERRSAQAPSSDLSPAAGLALGQLRPRAPGRPTGRMTTTQGSAVAQAPLPTTAVPCLPQAPLPATPASMPPQAPVATTGVPALPQMPLPAAGSGPFQERPSQREQPQLTMTNADADSGSVYLNFRGPIAKSVCIPPYQTVTVEMPIGEYVFQLWGDASSLQDGYAVFRARHEYNATWVTVTHSRFDPPIPLRLGDVQ